MAISNKKVKKLSIVIPVYNEADNFPSLLKEIQEHINTTYTIFVVYDFDEDTTVPVAKEFQKKHRNIKLVKNTIGHGALNAIKSGFAVVPNGACLVVMADLSDDLAKVDQMYNLYLQGASVVCASRYMKGGKQIGGPLVKRILSRLAGTSLYYIRRVPTHDITNNFKLYDKLFLDQITIESKAGFEIAMEITAKAFKMGREIAEVPATWRDRTAGKSNFKLWQWLPFYLKWYFYALF